MSCLFSFLARRVAVDKMIQTSVISQILIVIYAGHVAECRELFECSSDWDLILNV